MSPGRSGAKSLVIRSVSELFGEGLSRDLGGGGDLSGSLWGRISPGHLREALFLQVTGGRLSPLILRDSLFWSLRGLPGILAVQDLPRSLRRFSQTFVGERSPGSLLPRTAASVVSRVIGGGGVLLESAGGGVSPPPQVPFMGPADVQPF